MINKISRTSVADPHHLDADSYDIFPFDAYPFLIQIGSVADPDSYVLGLPDLDSLQGTVFGSGSSKYSKKNQ